MQPQKNNKVKLTKRVVESVTPDSTKRIFLWDTEVTGFCVRIYPSGKKTYFLQYRNKNKKTHKIKLGVHGTTTTELAREKAVKLSLSISVGEDPSVSLPAVKEATPRTIRDLADEYLRLHAKVKKTLRCYKEDQSFLKDVILKKYGNLPIVHISSFDIQNLHSGLKKTPYRANRVLALLSKMFNLAIQWGWRSDNPVKGIEKYQEYKRHRWLDDEELQRLWSTLDSYHNQSIANAVRLLLFTGARRTEALSARWSQFDLEKGVWTKPAHTTKQKRREYLPLSSQALNLLKAMKEEATTEHLFPGKIPGEPLKDIKKSWKIISNMAALSNARLHDLRHTHASHLVSSGLSLSIIGKLLGHTQTSTTQRYAHLADAPLRQAAELFGSKVAKLTSKNVEKDPTVNKQAS